MGIQATFVTLFFSFVLQLFSSGYNLKGWNFLFSTTSSSFFQGAKAAPPKPSQPSWIRGMTPTRFVARTHPLTREVVEDVNNFYLTHWPFPNEKARRKYVGMDLAGAMCSTWPGARNDRIFLVCRLFTVLFLIDDILEDMSLEEGRLLNQKLLSLMHGHGRPDRNKPAEWITYDTWKEMRTMDPELAQESLRCMATFMHAQTDPIKLDGGMTLDQYIKWRIEDVGAPLITSIGCYAAGLRITSEERTLLTALDANWSRHVIFLNDAWSYDKEFIKAHSSSGEGAVLCNSVTVIAKQAGVPADISKRLLLNICRELEVQHEVLSARLLARKDTPELRRYVQNLEWQMSGNEIWTKSTARYQVPPGKVAEIMAQMGEI